MKTERDRNPRIGSRTLDPQSGAPMGTVRKKARLSWTSIVKQAVAIVSSYDTGVTLRQLFYRLVSLGVIPNTTNAYKNLSRVTAKARRAGTFPDLIDRTRSIHVYESFAGPEEARRWLSNIYRRDRTENQDVSLYIGVEKHGLIKQLEAWFGDLGIPIVAVGGYSSQTFVDDIVRDAEQQGRPAVLIYAGDFDPSGEDIARDFEKRCGCFGEVVHVGLTAEQVDAYQLPPQMGKQSDPRAAAFVKRHGKLVQVELDALPPDILRGLYQKSIERFWDTFAFEAAMRREKHDRSDLRAGGRAEEGR